METLIHTSFALLASSSSDNNSGGLGLIFLLSGFVFYGYVYLRYRNVDKRNHYESETQATKVNIKAADELVESLTGLSNSKMHGANNHSVTGAGGLSLSMDQLSGSIGSIAAMVTKAAQQNSSSTAAPPPAPTPGSGSQAPPSGQAPPPPAAPAPAAPTQPSVSGPDPSAPPPAPPSTGQSF